MEDTGVTARADAKFQRSLSLPPNHGKPNKMQSNSVHGYKPNASNNNNEEISDSLFNRIGSIKHKLRVPKKADIRISKFEPSGINLSEEMLATIHDVEEKSLIDAVKTSNMCNGRVPCPYENHIHMTNHVETPIFTEKKRTHNVTRKFYGNRINLVKFLPGSSRRSSNSNVGSNLKPCVIKIVELLRNPNETLGIVIKKKRIPLQADISNGSHKRSNNVEMQEGIFISKLSSSCTASQQSLLHVGDEILAVNTIHVSSLDLKVVAAIMCQLQRLILTIRTFQRLPVSPSISSKKPSLFHFSSHPANKHPATSASNFSRREDTSTSLASLPEEKEARNPNDSANCFATSLAPVIGSQSEDVKHSIYDNNFNLDFANKKLSLSHHNLIQSKFDESVQILFDAIANCDKSSSSKENQEESKLDKITPQFSKSCEKEDNKDLSDSDSLLSEILQSVADEHQWKPFLTSNQNASSFHDYDDLESPIDNELVLSSSSSTQEINVDDVDSNCYDAHIYRNTLQHSQSLNPNTVPAMDANSQDTVKFFSADALEQTNDSNLPQSIVINKPHSSDSDIPLNELPNALSNGYGKVFSNNRTYVSNVPKFPVTLTDVPPGVISIMHPLINKSVEHGNVTVDKKREWLNSGGLVSDELKKRIDGDSNEKSNFLGNPTSLQKSMGHHIFYGNSSAPSSSNITDTFVPLKQLHLNVNGTSASTDEPSSLPVRCKNSLRSPVEKSAKSLFSVSSFPAKATFSINNANNDTSNEIGPSDFIKTDDLQSPYAEEQTMDPQKSKTDPQKVTSPSRSRKKNWKKITKKFRLPGNSDVGMSEYTCWTGEDLNPSLSNEAESSPDIANKKETPIANHYHLDASMANQRRLSRQLFLDNKNRELQQKSLNISQFQKYKPLPVIGNGNSTAVDGCLVITLYGVKELKKALCEAYCIVQVDDAATKRIGTTMQTCKGTTTWNQCFEMIISQAKKLHFTVYTWDTRGGKHRASSRALINLPLLMQGSKSSFTYSNRLAVSLEPRGTLYIRLALESSPSSSGPLLFGADLQSIADRENGPSVVPILVRSCIEEVEKRGMHIVGIYRLCGSAIVKKDLRRKLEEKAGKVDLDGNNYPDINVITGILKDFLRELPQPLFPPELLEVVTSAMEELPGPSSTTVIKEPFAPSQALFNSKKQNGVDEESREQKDRSDTLLRKINSLPAAPAERATLFALMNHLKKISLYSDSNKMTCQNLAVCFGPVLLGPVSTSPTSRMDLEAAIGFKRHIQVLNYMMSNWPVEPVRYIPANVVTRRKEKIAADRDSNRVSLTRRLSRVCVEEMDTTAEEGIKTSDLQTDPRASLVRNVSLLFRAVDLNRGFSWLDFELRLNIASSKAGIPEDAGMFRDPFLEMNAATFAVPQEL